MEICVVGVIRGGEGGRQATTQKHSQPSPRQATFSPVILRGTFTGSFDAQ